jgi:hypothetical protein
MLNDLKKKDPFYETYVKASDELTKLRQAHTILISMVQNNHINLKQTKDKEISSLILPSGLTANQPDG